jgi:hypothetical protein
MRKEIVSKLEEAKHTACAMIGVELELDLAERQEIAKLGFTIAASRKYGKYIVTWPQQKRAEALRAKVDAIMKAKERG